MKKHFSLYTSALSLLAALILQPSTLHAQTNAPSADSFPAVVQQWISSVDTNSTLFDTSVITLWTGNSYVNNSANASALGGDVRLWRGQSNNFQLTLEAQLDNAGIAGTLYSFQGGFGFQKAYNDLRLGAYLNGGWSIVAGKGFIEGGLDVRKGMSRTTFIGMRVGYQMMPGSTAVTSSGAFHSAGVFTAFTGVKL